MNNGYWYLLFKRVEYFARRFIKKIKNSGFDYIGLYWEDESDNQISKLVTICRDIGLKIEAMHGPIKDNMLIWDQNKYENDYETVFCLPRCGCRTPHASGDFLQ